MTDDTHSGREYGRVVFVLGSVLAVLVAGALLPTLIGPLGAAPLESLISPQSGAGGDSGGLGALNPGDSTDIGGFSSDGDTNALQSQSTETHFTVTATEGAYWRTGAYDTYTGSGWERTGETTAYDGGIKTDGLAGEEITYQVELRRAATALPTAWRPKTVDAGTPIEVTDQRAIAAPRGLAAGTTYEATSVRPSRDAETLAAAGEEYPTTIEQRYTQLPGSTPDRLGAFTDQLTNDTETQYETAVTIERWLETNKDYSLGVSAPGGNSVASDFVFGMDEGYCEYFATSMVAMLRTQGIPSRYAVGYSTGNQTGENTYTVRGMNAHAWTEVYFPDVGWVKFDPTPGQERLATEQRAIQEQEGITNYDPTEEGSPGEQFSPDESGTPDDPTQDDGDPGTDPGDDGPGIDPGDGDGPGSGTGTDTGGENQSGPYDVSLWGDPVPGTDVTVRVTRDGEPASGVVVRFNGEPIGTTARDGTITGQVPYEAPTLNVTVQAQSTASIDATAPAIRVDDDRKYALDSPVGDEPPPTANRSFEVPTNATLSIAGTAVTGETVTLTATVAGEPVPNATVEVDGEPVATTDESGRTDVTLPADPGSTTVSVRRGAVAGNRTLRLAALTVEAEPQLPVALPWTGVTVTAELGNETVSGVPVSINGESVATTGIDGTAAASLPFADSASLAVSAHGQRATATVGGLWRNLAVLLGTFAVAVAGAVFAIRRVDVRLGAILDRLVGTVLALPRYLLVGLVTGVDRVVDGIDRALEAGLDGLRSLWTGDKQAISAAIRQRIETVATRIRSIRSGPETASRTEMSSARVTIREAWERLLDHVSVRDPGTKTPGEIATHAVDRDGLPADAVATLRDTFRAVEYGARSPEQRLEAVQSAVEQLDGERERTDDERPDER
ncbi:DUF3488 and transglutaminase-like domain-containing protein [Halapricum desulfuricans]|uniref:Transglutaminase-like cysteine protease n=1 Tax=Halapricum desulfuricans TaxID=2841257 RepID=A0A897P0M4_9EURY|nr:DUF3488 and transglutaminase-like domain-containing protein [Halapricum desulfuricans]QSG15816.1 Transglutaminase-like cysteine protease [Halapricum desulfuricans]